MGGPSPCSSLRRLYFRVPRIHPIYLNHKLVCVIWMEQKLDLGSPIVFVYRLLLLLGVLQERMLIKHSNTNNDRALPQPNTFSYFDLVVL